MMYASAITPIDGQCRPGGATAEDAPADAWQPVYQRTLQVSTLVAPAWWLLSSPAALATTLGVGALSVAAKTRRFSAVRSACEQTIAVIGLALWSGGLAKMGQQHLLGVAFVVPTTCAAAGGAWLGCRLMRSAPPTVANAGAIDLATIADADILGEPGRAAPRGKTTRWPRACGAVMRLAAGEFAKYAPLGRIDFALAPQRERLRILDLHDNGLRKLPPSIWKLPALLELDISGNALLDLSNHQPSRSLVYCNARNNQLRDARGLAALAPNLKALDLSHNFITTIPHNWSTLGLYHLDLTHNRLTGSLALPPMTQLEVLRLDDNRIATIEGLAQCSALRELSVANNGALQALQCLPPSLDTVDITGGPCRLTDTLEALLPLRLRADAIETAAVAKRLLAGVTAAIAAQAWPQARRLLESPLATSLNQPSLATRLAHVCLHQNDTAGAAQACAQARGVPCDAATSRSYAQAMAEIAYRRADSLLDEAEQRGGWREALRHDPEHAGANLALAAHATPGEAYHMLRTAYRCAPDFPGCAEAYARVCEQWATQQTDALLRAEMLCAAADASPRGARAACVAAGRALKQIRRWADAQVYLSYALPYAGAADASLLDDLAEVHVALARWHQAEAATNEQAADIGVENYKLALKYVPGQLNAIKEEYARALAQQGEHVCLNGLKARLCAMSILPLDPVDSQANAFLGRWYAQLRQYAKAEQAFLKADAAATHVDRNAALEQHVKHLFSQGKMDEAWQLMLEADEKRGLVGDSWRGWCAKIARSRDIISIQAGVQEALAIAVDGMLDACWGRRPWQQELEDLRGGVEATFGLALQQADAMYVKLATTRLGDFLQFCSSRAGLPWWDWLPSDARQVAANKQLRAIEQLNRYLAFLTEIGSELQ